MIKILALYGSHRRGQNSDILLDFMLKGMERENVEIKRIYISGLNIKPCLACNHCYRDGICIIKDDVKNIYQDFEEADIVITATPIYFNSVSSYLKILIDRCQSIWAGKYILGHSPISKKKRLGYVICVGGAPEPNEGLDCTMKVLDMFYKCINVEMIGKKFAADTDKTAVIDRVDLCSNVSIEGERLLKNIMNKSEVDNNG